MQRLHLTFLTFVSVFSATLLADGANIRLANGINSCSGRVEVYYNNQWGTVCDDNWDLNDAHVVCRQLGCGKAVSAHRNAHFGQGNGKIWLDEVQCSGSESDITQCRHNGFGINNCEHDDAGVTCSASLAPYIGVGVTAGLLLIFVPVIICYLKMKKRKKGARNSFEIPQEQEQTDSDDSEADYENAETNFQQKKHSGESDNDYEDVDGDDKRRALSNDYEEADIISDYENAEIFKQKEDSEDSDDDYVNAMVMNKKVT